MSAETDLEARGRLLDALAAGANNSDASRTSGYSRKHVIALQKDETFLAELEERKRALAEGDTGARSRAARVGLDVLLEIAKNKDAQDAARVSAAKALLALDAPRTAAKAPKDDAAPAAPAGPEPTPEELQRSLRVLA